MPRSTRPRAATKPRARQVSVTPEQALQFAIERHRLGRLDEAEPIYTTLLERWPDHADVLNHLGLLRHQRGDRERALTLLQRAVEIAPDASGIWNNLGTVLLHFDPHDAAEQAFRRSIALADNAPAQANLSRVLRRDRRFDDSEAASRRATELAPTLADGWHQLSLVLLDQGRVRDGIAAANRSLLLTPLHLRRRDTYARALVLAGEIEQAAEVFRQWAIEEPDNAYVQHHLAACRGQPAPARASDAYVESVFDNFADTFDRKLARLRYRAPELVAQALRAVLPVPARQFDIADLGCGTGLCGPLLRGWARHLAGCDLSGAMLEHAQRRAVYDELEKAELVQYLEARPGRFDIVVSADTLCYFGQIDAACRAARRALRAGGWLAFTVEALPSGDGADHRLLAHGRYAHGRGYLEAQLAAAGLTLRRIAAEVLREEAGTPVDGWLVTATHGG